MAEESMILMKVASNLLLQTLYLGRIALTVPVANNSVKQFKVGEWISICL